MVEKLLVYLIMEGSGVWYLVWEKLVEDMLGLAVVLKS